MRGVYRPESNVRVLLTALAVCLSGAIGCHRAPEEVSGPQTVGVTVHTAAVGPIRDVASAPGVIVPSAAADLTVFAPEAGQLVELPKKEQDPVATGDVLAKFEIASISQDLAARELEVNEATTRVERAKGETSKFASLVERGLAPRNQLENSRAEQLSAEASLTQAQSLLANAKLNEERAVVKARFPGIVMKVWHAAGDRVTGSADPILRVIDPTRMQVSVQLPIPQLARVLPGQVATVRAFSVEGDLPATVAMKPQTSDPSLATGEVRLAFVNPSTLTIDAPVSVEILLDQRTNALVVPAAALQRDDRGPFLMVAGADGHAHRHDVGLGLVTKEVAEVVSGLAAGDRVIVTGLSDVNDGTAIVISR